MEGSHVQGPPQLHSALEANLNCVRKKALGAEQEKQTTWFNFSKPCLLQESSCSLTSIGKNVEMIGTSRVES